MLTLRASTPVKNTCNSATKFAATIQPLKVLHHDMDSEMRKHFVGPMPVRKFLDDFLPVQLPQPQKRLPGFQSVPSCGPEKAMYSKFVGPFLQPHPFRISKPLNAGQGRKFHLHNHQGIRYISKTLLRRRFKIQA